MMLVIPFMPGEKKHLWAVTGIQFSPDISASFATSTVLTGHKVLSLNSLLDSVLKF